MYCPASAADKIISSFNLNFTLVQKLLATEKTLNSSISYKVVQHKLNKKNFTLDMCVYEIAKYFYLSFTTFKFSSLYCTSVFFTLPNVNNVEYGNLQSANRKRTICKRTLFERADILQKKDHRF